MWPEEIELTCKLLERYSRVKTCLNVGSEGIEYRHNRQPWNKKLDDFLYLREIKIDTLDLDPKSNPTYLLDITQASNLPKYDLVIATHLLEHIKSELVDLAIDNIVRASEELLIISVPHKYPFHARPIDNLWRPSAIEIVSRIGDRATPLYAQIFETEHTYPEFKDKPKCSVSYCLFKI